MNVVTVLPAEASILVKEARQLQAEGFLMVSIALLLACEEVKSTWEPDLDWKAVSAVVMV